MSREDGRAMFDAELVVGLHRHLGAFTTSASTAALGDLQFAGKIYELAFRLRGSGVSRLGRVEAIAVESAIAPYELKRVILPTLKSLGWVAVTTAKDGAQYVEETIPPMRQLLDSSDQVFQVVSVSSVARAALQLLRSTTAFPLEKTAALNHASSDSAEDAENALASLENVRLLRTLIADDGREVVFNPNVWVDDADAVTAALRIEDSRVKAEIGGLIEEIQANQGMPADRVTAASDKWIDFAVNLGLIQRSVVATTTGEERSFLFTPHLQRDSFGAMPSDASGHVRQLVGSMVYAATYPKWKLDDPATFIRSLIRNGRAGNASPIGTDYPMLETAGIVRVVEGSGSGRFAFELLQGDVAESALKILEEHPSTGANNDSQAIVGQRSYRHLELERARFAEPNPARDRDTKRLIAAIRQSATSGG